MQWIASSVNGCYYRIATVMGFQVCEFTSVLPRGVVVKARLVSVIT